MYFWKGSRPVSKTGGGPEWYNYPTALAREYWYHVTSLGKARLKRGHRNENQVENAFLLHYVRRGEFWYRIRGRSCRAPAGTVCLMNLNDPVQYGNDRPSTAEIWWIDFNSREMPHMFTELRADHHPLFDHLDTGRLEALLSSLFDLVRLQPPAYEPRVAAALLGIVAELFSSRAKTGDFVNLVGRAAVLSEPVRKGIDYMTRFHASPMSLKRVCAAVDQSIYHFVRVFHREVGAPPIQYLNRYRIEQAKRLLANSNEPIDQIRPMVGIPNPVHFSRLFRQIAGTSPSEYRAVALRRRRGKPSLPRRPG
jgi:AraC-like DNA-binding protein